MLRSIGLVSSLAFLMVGCGGGSGSGPPPPPPDSVVVSASPTPPAGVATNPYEGFSFSASGGSPPFTWAVTSGALPGGLTLTADGTLSGTPSAVGPFAFTVTATDSAQTPGTGSQPFSVPIDTPAAPLIDPGEKPPAGGDGPSYGLAFPPPGGHLPLSWAVTAGALPPAPPPHF